MRLTSQIIVVLFFLVPLVLLTFSVVYIVQFFRAKWKNKKCPGTFPDNEIKWRRSMMIVWTVLFGVPSVIVLRFMIMLFFGAANM